MTVLADFSVLIEGWPEARPVDREVRVVVYDSLKGLRIAAGRHGEAGTHGETLGICHRFAVYADNDSWPLQPLCAIVRLAEPHLGVGIISHEMTHAAVWIRELAEGETPLTCRNDEEFCWLVGELVRQTVNGMNASGVYEPA